MGKDQQTIPYVEHYIILKIYQKTKDYRKIAEEHYIILKIYQKTKDYRKIAEEHYIIWKIYQKTKDYRKIAEEHYIIWKIYQKTKDCRKIAEEHYIIWKPISRPRIIERGPVEYYSNLTNNQNKNHEKIPYICLYLPIVCYLFLGVLGAFIGGMPTGPKVFLAFARRVWAAALHPDPL